MTKSDHTRTHELILDPNPPELAELNRRFDVLYEKVLTILREADINANYLTTRFEYDLEAFIIVLDLDHTHNRTDIENLIQDAGSFSFPFLPSPPRQHRRGERPFAPTRPHVQPVGVVHTPCCVFLDVDYRDQTRELNSPVQDAFSERFGDVLHVGEQERLRVQYAVDHIWQLWMAYQKKNERMLSTRAGVLLAYRQKGM